MNTGIFSDRNDVVVAAGYTCAFDHREGMENALFVSLPISMWVEGVCGVNASKIVNARRIGIHSRPVMQKSNSRNGHRAFHGEAVSRAWNLVGVSCQVRELVANRFLHIEKVLAGTVKETDLVSPMDIDAARAVNASMNAGKITQVDMLSSQRRKHKLSLSKARELCRIASSGSVQ